jgi:diguanylate cyclase (GGDEF)-like protein
MAESEFNPKRRKAQPTSNLVFFDDRTALHLTQAFGQENDLEPLLGLLFKQIQALTNAGGMQYIYKPLGINITIGEQTSYNADYNLSFRDAQLGKLQLYFAQHHSEHDLQTCEDLISMAFVALRNAVTVLELRNKPEPISTAERQSLAAVAPLAKEEKSDALILLALDDYSAIRSRDGEEWAQILMSSVHEQINEGLREADGVYHIGDDLIAVLLPNTTGSQAQEVAKKVRTLVASLHLRGGELQASADGVPQHQLTACMGLSDARSAKTAEEVMQHARLALATAQQNGKNQIGIYQAEEHNPSGEQSGSGH